MDVDKLVKSADPQMDKALEHLRQEIAPIRTGRATPAMVDNVKAEAYGQTQPIKHMASIVVSDPKTITISPYDPSNLSAIEKAIRDDQTVDLNPLNDGKVLRIQMPDMTTERRKATVKILGEKAEEAKITLRNIRHEILDEAKKAEGKGDISKDDLHDATEAMDQKIQDYQKQIDDIVSAKEDEIMEV